MMESVRQTRAGHATVRSHLGGREEQVLRLIADGYSSKEIARNLQIAPSTVEVHRRNIMRKVGLHKVADLTRYAIRNQMVSV
jgi:two-component system NarL family response regulator